MIDPDDLIDTLILEGALVIQGVDENGEITYNFTDKLAEMAPELYKEFNETIYTTVLSLWEMGLVSMDIMSESPLISVTEIGLDRNNWKGLDDYQTQVMINLMKAFEGEL